MNPFHIGLFYSAIANRFASASLLAYLENGYSLKNGPLIVRAAYERVCAFFDELKAIAPQLTPLQ